MKPTGLILLSGLVSFWLLAIALIAIQNVQSVSLKFFFLQSVTLPFGLILAAFVALGMVGTAIAIGILSLKT